MTDALQAETLAMLRKIGLPAGAEAPPPRRKSAAAKPKKARAEAKVAPRAERRRSKATPKTKRPSDKREGNAVAAAKAKAGGKRTRKEAAVKAAPPAEVVTEVEAPAEPDVDTEEVAARIRDVVAGARVPLWPGSKRAEDEGEAPEPWYSLAAALPAITEPAPELSRKQKQLFLDAAKELLEMECGNFARRRRATQDGDARWMDQLAAKGTLQDRVAAMTLQISASPLHALDALEQLVGLAAKKERRTQSIALEALKDVFVHNLLPDRRLTRFAQRPLGAADVTPRHLVLWHVESSLARLYGALLDVIEQGSFDTVESQKHALLDLAVELLAAKPEGEARLLGMLVNKLGDPGRKTGARVVRGLQLLLEEHAAMKEVVAYEVQQYLHRAGLAPRAVYMGVCFLNQLKFSDGDGALAAKLTQTYFEIFEARVTIRPATSRAAAAGATDATPGARGAGEAKARPGKPRTRKQKKSARDDEGDELSPRILGALLTGVARAHPYCSHAEGGAFDYIEKYADTLFRMVHMAPAGTAVTALQLLYTLACGQEDGPEDKSAMSEDFQRLRNRFFRALYERLQVGDFLAGKKATLWLNLVFKAMLADDIPARVAAYAKRVASLALHAPAPAAAGILFLLSAVAQQQPVVSGMLELSPGTCPVAVYDFHARDPLYALRPPDAASGRLDEAVTLGPELVPPPLFEMAMAARHVHPSVTAFAGSILLDAGHRVSYPGDPLKDFALGPFLSRFVMRNPKQRDVQRLRSVAGVRSRPATNPEAPDPSYLTRLDAIRSEREANSLGGLRRKTEKDSEEPPAGEDGEVDLDGAAAALAQQEDEEYEAFAEKLAEDLMRSGGGDTFDDDDVNFSDEDLVTANDDDGDMEDADGLDGVFGSDSELDDGSDGDLDEEFAAMDGLAGADGDAGEDEGPDENDAAEDDASDGEGPAGGLRSKAPRSKSKLELARKRAGGSTFATADDFEDLIEASDEKIQELWGPKGAGKRSSGGKRPPSAKRRRRSG